jgi:hypothetical protein
MSEYQYYEFQAIDRPLDTADRDALRALSSRARITATSFTNSYEWGDLKADPAELVEKWFDLHLYVANWGARRLMLRWPARLVDRHCLGAFLRKGDCATIRKAGSNLILDIGIDEMESEDFDDGSGCLAALAPLRADVLAGDLRLFYLVWLMGVEADMVEPDEPEPMPGIGPMTGALEAFTDFFSIDRDLVTAAAEQSAASLLEQHVSSARVRPVIKAMTDAEKTGLLTRLFEGDAHVASELRASVRRRLVSDAGTPRAPARTVGQLRARADAIRCSRERSQAEAAAAEHKQRAEEAERARRSRLDALRRRGERVWHEIESEIERRNPAAYDRAGTLLTDLGVIAEQDGKREDFVRRLKDIRSRHARKERFIEKLAALG